MNKRKNSADAIPKRAASVSLRGRYGRIVRSKNGKPLSLTEDTDRRVVMVMGPGGLKTLQGRTGYEMVNEIGYTGDYISRKLAEGFAFHLVTFLRPAGELRIATWKNTLAVIADAYPEVADVIISQLKALKQTSFEDFERQAGFKFADVDTAGHEDARFMTAQRLLESDRSALSVRRFLYHTMRLSELYTGTGMTKTNIGKRGVREYIMRNRPVSQLEGCALTELQIIVPNAS